MDHREASLLLVEYVKGGMSADQRQAVADHVAAHPECADTVRFLEQLDADLKRHRGKLLAEHPAAAALVAYAVGADEDLETVERVAVAAHVGRCADCFGDLQTVRRVHAELSEAPQTAPAGGRHWFGGWTTLGASLAAGVLLGVMAQRFFSPISGYLAWEGPVPVVRLAGNLRDDALPAFAVPATAPAIPFVVMWDPWQLPGAAAGTPLVIRVEDTASGREVWRLATTIGEAWDAAGRVSSFLAPASALGSGEKTLTIAGPDGAAAFTSRLSLNPR
jgi:hypothetical protein